MKKLLLLIFTFFVSVSVSAKDCSDGEKKKCLSSLKVLIANFELEKIKSKPELLLDLSNDQMQERVKLINNLQDTQKSLLLTTNKIFYGYKSFINLILSYASLIGIGSLYLTKKSTNAAGKFALKYLTFNCVKNVNFGADDKLVHSLPQYGAFAFLGVVFGYNCWSAYHSIKNLIISKKQVDENVDRLEQIKQFFIVS